MKFYARPEDLPLVTNGKEEVFVFESFPNPRIFECSSSFQKKKKRKTRGWKGSCKPIAILVCTTANNRVYGIKKEGGEKKKKKGASYARQKGKLYRRCNM